MTKKKWTRNVLFNKKEENKKQKLISVEVLIY